MIKYFPTPYPDELLYSLLARYYVKAGHLAYIYAAEDLYVKRTTRPDVEFINKLTDEVKSIITRDMSMEDIIQKHTMFPYYGRFLKYERKKRAFDTLVSMKGNYHNLLVIPVRGVGYLRYCPLCVEEDREKYGETYWHRTHQMSGVDICPEHFCELQNSSVAISSKQSPCLISAEEEVIENIEVCFETNGLKKKLAGYISSVFQAHVDVDNTVGVGEFLHSKMYGTKYLSRRGGQRNMTIFFEDFNEGYKNFPDISLKELWQIEKIFTNDRYNTREICQLAMFLGISSDELTNMKLPEKTQQQVFDEEILRLHKQGLKYPEIARRLNASYDVVKAIGEGRY